MTRHTDSRADEETRNGTQHPLRYNRVVEELSPGQEIYARPPDPSRGNTVECWHVSHFHTLMLVQASVLCMLTIHSIPVFYGSTIGWCILTA
jgi:hypothetical protein